MADIIHFISDITNSILDTKISEIRIYNIISTGLINFAE